MKYIHRSRLLAAGVALAVTALAISACSSSSPTESASPTEALADPAADVTVVYAYDGTFTQSLQSIFDGWEAESGITPNLELAGENYEAVVSRIRSAAAAGQELPDLAMMGLNRIRELVDAGVAVDLSSFIASDPDFQADQFSDSTLALAQIDGKQYGLPFVTSTPVLYYNADIFRAAGLDPDNPPTTWDEIREASETIVESGAAKHGVFWRQDNFVFQSTLASNGGSMMNEDQTEVTFDSQEGVEALAFLKGLADDGLMPVADFNVGIEGFYKGETAMWVDSTSAVRSAESNTDFDLKVSTFPASGSQELHLATGGNAFVILAEDPARQAAAWEALKQLTSEEGSTIITENSGYVPVNNATAEALSGMLESEPNRQAAFSQVPFQQQWFNWPGESGVDITQMLEAAIQRSLLGEDPKTALQQAASDVEGLLP